MPDFQQIVRERLRDCRLSPVREAEIADEIAQHLKDRYEPHVKKGRPREGAGRGVGAGGPERDGGGVWGGGEPVWSEPVALGARAGSSFWASLWQDVRYGAR